MQKDYVYLSKRNVLTLLSKLNRFADGEPTACTLIKNDNVHPMYPQTMDRVYITAIEDGEGDHVGIEEIGAHLFLTRDTLTMLAYHLALSGQAKVYSTDVGDSLVVSIVEDDQYYIDREAGPVLGRDDPDRKSA